VSSQSPLVSVVIPCYNAEAYVAAAIRSCLNQDYPSLEIIVIDDGSTDGSREIVASYAPRVTLISASHQGHNAARNLGYAVSHGDFVQFFDADDVLAPDKISTSLRAFDADPALDVVFMQLFAPRDYRFDERVTIPDLSVGRQTGTMGRPYPYDEAIRVPHLNTSQALYRRRALERYGLWDESLPVYDDLELNFRMYVSGARFLELDRIGIVYRHYPTASRVSYREHVAHPAALPAMKKLVDLTAGTTWARTALGSYMRGMFWQAARECMSSLRVSQARTYLALARRLDPGYVDDPVVRAAIGLVGPLPTVAAASFPRFVVKTSRCARYGMTLEEAFFESIAPVNKPWHAGAGNSTSRSGGSCSVGT
jgi:GT2 family glycosyltransferase